MSSTVKLVFRNSRERAHFMGGLSDGWGEGICSLKSQPDSDRVKVFRVTLSTDELAEMERHELLDLKFGGPGLTAEQETRLEELQNR